MGGTAETQRTELTVSHDPKETGKKDQEPEVLLSHYQWTEIDAH